MSLRVVFMGTPDFAVGTLMELLAAGHEVALVVTQPDKPKGRGKAVGYSPVKECALSHGIEVSQPKKIREADCIAYIKSISPDIIVVAAFGQILSEEILTMPRYGCVNIHASLLPKYRGAGPIQWAIINGEEKTGVTIMQMDKGIDTGDMLLKTEVMIDPKETGDSLHDKLARAGAELIVEALPKIERGELVPVRQKDEESCYAKMLQKSMGQIDWQQSAKKLDCLIRGLISWPGACTRFRGKNLKIWEEEVASKEALTLSGVTMEGDGASFPGTVSKDAFYVWTGDGILKILSVQPEGKRRMPVKEFLLGYQIKNGEQLG